MQFFLVFCFSKDLTNILFQSLWERDAVDVGKWLSDVCLEKPEQSHQI